MGKWPGGQNGGNHCCRTKYRKRNEKKNEESIRDLWKTLNTPTFASQESQEEEEREKGPEKIFEKIIAENLPNMGKGNNQPSSGSTESPRSDKPKEEHNRDKHTVIKLTKIKDRDKILKATRGK